MISPVTVSLFVAAIAILIATLWYGTRRPTCPTCHGYGMIVDADDFRASGFAGPDGPTCPRCNGKGSV